MIADIVLPCLALGLIGWAVPALLDRVLTPGYRGLALNAAISVALLLAAGAALFGWLYGPTSGAVWRETPGHFIRLSAQAALVWGPILALSLAQRPGRWPPEAREAPGARDDP